MDLRPSGIDGQSEATHSCRASAGGNRGIPRNVFFVFVAFGLAIAGGSAFY
jgi:hypothetical protein